MITEFQLSAYHDERIGCHVFMVRLKLADSDYAVNTCLIVADDDVAAYHDLWSNWGWDELMKFLAYNFVDAWDTQDTYSRYSLLEEGPSV